MKTTMKKTPAYLTCLLLLFSQFSSCSNDNSCWKKQKIDYQEGLKAIWGSSSSDIFAVGYDGTILHFNGERWSEMNLEYGVLKAVWGTSPEDVYTVDNHIWHYNGEDWRQLSDVPTGYYYGIWGSAEGDVFAVGSDGKVINYDGNQWSEMVTNTTATLKGVWGSSSSDVYAVGELGTVLHFDGINWTEIDSPFSRDFNGIWGSSPTNIYTVSGDGIFLYDGLSWDEVTAGDKFAFSLESVYGNSASNIFAVGYSGKVYHFDGQTWEEIGPDFNGFLDAVWVSKEGEVYTAGCRYEGYNCVGIIYQYTCLK